MGVKLFTNMSLRSTSTADVLAFPKRSLFLVDWLAKSSQNIALRSRKLGMNMTRTLGPSMWHPQVKAPHAFEAVQLAAPNSRPGCRRSAQLWWWCAPWDGGESPGIGQKSSRKKYINDKEKYHQLSKFSTTSTSSGQVMFKIPKTTMITMAASPSPFFSWRIPVFIDVP